MFCGAVDCCLNPRVSFVLNKDCKARGGSETESRSSHEATRLCMVTQQCDVSVLHATREQSPSIALESRNPKLAPWRLWRRLSLSRIGQKRDLLNLPFASRAIPTLFLRIPEFLLRSPSNCTFAATVRARLSRRIPQEGTVSE